LRINAAQKDSAQNKLMLKYQTLKEKLEATKVALKEADVKIAFLKGMIVPEVAKHQRSQWSSQR
jgi:hypothetical protein